MEFHLTATGRHLPYGITQCYLPPDTSERAPPSLQPVSRYSIYLPRRDGRLSWPRLPGSAPAGNRTRDLSITSPTPYHYTNRATHSSGWKYYSEISSLLRRNFCVTYLLVWCSVDRGILMTFGSGAYGCLGHDNCNDVSQVFMSTCLSLCLSVCLSVYLFVSPSVCLPVLVSSFHLCISVSLSVCLPACVSVCQCFFQSAVLILVLVLV